MNEPRFCCKQIMISSVCSRTTAIAYHRHRLPSLPSRAKVCLRVSSTETPSYQGRFGTFTVGPEDEKEVFLYRAGINVAAAGKYRYMLHACMEGLSAWSACSLLTFPRLLSACQQLLSRAYQVFFPSLGRCKRPLSHTWMESLWQVGSQASTSLPLTGFQSDGFNPFHHSSIPHEACACGGLTRHLLPPLS